MTAQPTFWDSEPPRATVNTRPLESLPAPGRWDVPSAEAAEKMQKSGQAAEDRAEIYEWLRDNGPCTDERIQDACGISGNSERARRGEMVKLGIVVKVDTEGKTKGGNKATRWGLACFSFIADFGGAHPWCVKCGVRRDRHARAS